jgi:excinuclease ABC subunit C
MSSIAQQLKSLPKKPGVYIFKNVKNEVLYVGKAKSLRVRVKSYFRANANLDLAKQQMIPKITSLDTILCDSENEALILEANLIRQYRPPYNVVLTDDKHYLFIKITKDPFPRVYPVRRLLKDKAYYFGPYSSAHSVRSTLKLLRRVFPFKGEKDSPQDRVLPHVLFNSDSVSNQLDQTSYQSNINHLIRFLRGDRDHIIKTLQTGMRTSARARQFERAALFRDQLQAIERLEGHQKVYLPRPESFDVLSLAHESNRSAANVFSVRQGKLISKNTFLLKHSSGTPSSDILRQFILQYYQDAQDIPNLILLPTQLPHTTSIRRWINSDHPPTFKVPHRGSKKQLIAMGTINAQQLLSNERSRFEQTTQLKSALTQLARALQIKNTSLHRIETYDISNIQGAHATGSMVVFIDGQPKPSEYRKFRLKPEPGLPTGQANDYRMLQQVLTRRFANAHADWPQPDLILIDGGKGQLSSTLQILNQMNLTIPIASLAKQNELLFIPYASEPIQLPYDSDALYLVMRMRDEAHRFTIQYHRLLRSKRSTRSILDDIPGIGPKTKRKLINHFGSIQRIRESSLEEIESIIGSKATTLKEFL